MKTRIDKVMRAVWDSVPTHWQNLIPWAIYSRLDAAAARVDRRERRPR